MAKSKDSSISQESEIFNKGLIKDYDDIFYPEGTWSHARNATNFTVGGDQGIIGNEQGNKLCALAPYTIIGQIRITSDHFLIFSTNDLNSEIGIFTEGNCLYTKVVNDSCLNFKKSNLIIGTSKENFDCTFQVYWSDGVNPDRTLNIGDVRLGPFEQPWPGVPYICEDVNSDPDCVDCQPSTPYTLDCEEIRLARLISTPCIEIRKGASSGTLLNGSYYAVIAYSVNGQKVTEYYSPSIVQPLFSHANASGSLELTIRGLDSKTFDEFELVIVRTINQQTSAKRIGLYSTKGDVEIAIDYINESLPTIPIEQIPIRSQVIEKSEGIFVNGPYMLRTSPTGRFDFNYQPIANKIETEWVMIEAPIDYYRKGGNVTGYMRDEQYAFWIRFVYNTGDYSSSYHIPGRAKEVGREIDNHGTEYEILSPGSSNDVAHQASVFNNLTNLTTDPFWRSVNTAYVTSLDVNLQDTEQVIPFKTIATGKMGYWESTEKYPDTKPEVWNSSYHTWSNSGNPNHDLCGKPIRHHKMPGEILDYSPTNLQGTEGLGITRNPVLNASSYEIKNTARAIRILGVRFKNIYTPLDNDGNPIPGIVAYEILRSSRDGNRSIIAKGVVKNMRSYKNVDNETIYYQNYPYNFRGADKSLTKLPFYSGNPSQYTTGSDGAWNNPSNFLTDYSQSFLSFHSPDTQFKNPFLSANELHLYKQLGRYQNIKGTFAPVDGHPLEKLPTNLVFFISAVIGLGLAGKSVHGKHTRVLKSGRTSNLVGALPANPAPALAALDESALESRFPGFTRIFTEAVTGVNPAVTTYLIANAVGDAALLTPGVTGEGSTREITIEPSDQNYLPTLLRGAVGVVTYLNYFAEGAQSVFNILLNIMSYTQYAQAYTSHGYFHYSSKGNVDIATNSRRFIKDAGYIDNQLQSIGDKTINNLYRGRFVALDLIGNLNDPSGTDDSLKILSDRVTAANITDEGISRPFYSNSYMYYGALKLAFRNQYGQLTSVKQLTTRCRFPYKPLLNISNIYTVPVIAESSLVFGGDVYIGRYTEKNTFFYFYDWLSNQPDGTEFDYRLRTMVSNPRFWADFTKFDITSFLNTALNKAVDGNFGQMLEGLPTNMFNLDLDEQLTVSSYINASSEEDPGIFSGLLDFINSASDAIDGSAVNNMKSANRLRFLKKNAYFYLFQSGVIDLFVESEINIDLRDWGEDPSERHYDPYAYTNLRELFDIDHIKSGNYFKYDISLSVSKIFNNFISWGNMQPTYYNPSVAETCFTYYPNRVIYSLPQQDEAVKDYWRVFLPNNYKDFTSKPISVKQISKNGALLLFETQSPAQFLGVDTLQTDTGTKITIGDGGLFSQPLQYLTNADAEFQHGSCQNRLSVTNTPAGVYYLSQSQGKVFAVTGNGIEEISAAAMRWWFNKYLPYQLIKDFPNYYLTDNPVVGIGCQSVFDNTNQILYFSKRDFRRRRDFAGSFQYAPQYGYNKFLINDSIQVTLGDPDYFEDCSWTISYDPKNKMWISFHDWHPELTISSKNYFITTKTLQSQAGGIWKHNDNDYEFCRYYGISYPFEIEFIAATGQTVNTLKSLEYDLECYTYDIDGIDMYHVLDFNFDHAIVHNTEQVSGVLNLNLNPKGNPIAALQYPKINPTSIDIIFSKEEQKYRFNQFWDITRDRGEFTYPNVQQPIWNTELNGYKRDLNINNLDYQKASFERKKFRHYTTHVLLSRSVSGPVKMLFKITNVKNQYSPR
jgi:hypothetical protein